MKTIKTPRGRLQIIIGFLLFLAFSSLQAQDIQRAGDFFDKVSAVYGKIEDYEAKITITQTGSTMTGTIWYKIPHLIRIDFDQPERQVMTIAGDSLLIYVPGFQVVLSQTLPKRSVDSLQSMANTQGLNFLRDYYRVSFLVGPDPIPLDEDSEENVIKLKFIWRDAAEGFKEIIISFNPDRTIRRIKGKKAIDNNYVQFDFENIKLNQGIPDERFNYNPPPDANVYNDFLFGEKN